MAEPSAPEQAEPSADQSVRNECHGAKASKRNGSKQVFTLSLNPLILFDMQKSADPKKRSPSDFLKSVLGRPVRVKLNSGIEYRGVLACLDGYLNIAMEQTEEFVDGQLKAKYGDCFIRGNNGRCWRTIRCWCCRVFQCVSM